MALVGTKVKELRKALGVVGGSAPAAEAGGGEEEEEEDEEEMEPADGGHAMYLAAWIWCRDEYKKGGRGVHKIRAEALGMAQFSRFVPSAKTILDAAKNDLREPRDYTNSTRVPHMPTDATDAVAKVVVAMRALPLECEKLLAVLDHRFFNGKKGENARFLLDEQSKKPREKPAAAEAPAAQTQDEQEKALADQYGFF